MFKPKEGVLLIEKFKNKDLAVDITMQETDDDKRLITGKILVGNNRYNEGTIIVFGKYSLFLLCYLGKDYYFLDQDDVIATLDESYVE